MLRKEFEEKLNYIRDELLCAAACFDMYEIIYNQQYIDVNPMNLVPGFFQVVQHSSINCAALHLARLYEKNGEITLYKLRNLLRQHYIQFEINKDIAMSAIKEIDRLWKESYENIEKVKQLRDKSLAHNDKENLIGTLWQDVGLTAGNYRQLIFDAHRAICIYYNILHLPEPALLPSNKRDLEQILYALKALQK